MLDGRRTGMGRTSGSRVTRRGIPVLVALAPAVVLAICAGPAAAASPRTGPAGQAGPAGVISTVAGGVGGPAKATQLRVDPCGISYRGGHLLIADDAAVREVSTQTDWLTTPAGTGTTVGTLGDGGPASKATLAQACGTAMDRFGNIVVTDTGDDRLRVVAARTGTFYGLAMTAGDIYTVAGTGKDGFKGNGGPAISAELSAPEAVAVDSAGNLVLAELGNSDIRVIPVRTGTFYGRAMTAHHIYVVAGIGGHEGFSGDGGPATSALLSPVGAVALDGAGNLVIGDTKNNRIRVVAESTATFYGQAMTAGDIYTVAGTGTGGFSGDGGPATAAELNNPFGVAVDGPGNIVIADTDNHRVRVVAESTGTFYGRAMTAGDIYTVAGTGTPGFSGDGGPASGAELNNPSGVALDGTGNLVIADQDNGRARLVAASTGTFYGKAMTAGDIYTVAGHGFASSGDGRPRPRPSSRRPSPFAWTARETW